MFSDGDEFRTFNKCLNGSQKLPRLFQVKFTGHKNARFIGAEVVEAY